MKKLILSLFFIAFLAPVHPAKALLLDSISGLKLSFGAQYLTSPEPPENNEWFFEGKRNIWDGEGNGYVDEAWGLGYGIQAYYEISLIKLVSIETGLGYRNSEIKRASKVTVTSDNFIGKYEYVEKCLYDSLHIPLIAKLNVPGGFTLGLGFDFDFPIASEGKVEINEKSIQLAESEKKKYYESVNPVNTSSVYGVFSLGYTFSIPGILEIPLAIQGMKNLSIEDEWTERVKINRNNGIRNFDIKTQDSWQLKIIAGAGFKF